MQISEQQIGNEDLVVISAAVHFYLNNGQIKELNNQRTLPLGYPVIKVARPKHNKWKWSFFPYMNSVKDVPRCPSGGVGWKSIVLPNQ